MRILVTRGAGFIGDELKATIEWYWGNGAWWELLHRPAPPARTGA